MDTAEKVQICKLVALAIMVDVQMTEEEITFLDKLMTQYELTDEQRRDVQNRNFDDDPEQLASEVVSAGGRDVLLTELARAVMADGALVAEEIRLLARVGAALGVTGDDVQAALDAAG